MDISTIQQYMDISNEQSDKDLMRSLHGCVCNLYLGKNITNLEPLDIIVEFAASLKKVKNINTQYNGTSLLSLICKMGDKMFHNQYMTHLANLLIERGVDINARDRYDEISGSRYDQNTALCYACDDANNTIIEFLLKNKADPNVHNGSKMYPITFCLDRLNYRGIKLLIEYGSIVNVPTIIYNPLYCLLHTNYLSIRLSSILKKKYLIFNLLLNCDDLDTSIIDPVKFRDFMEQNKTRDIFIKRQNSYKAELLNCVDISDHPMHVFGTNYGDVNIFGIIVDYLL